jgi:hypothetical protein
MFYRSGWLRCVLVIGMGIGFEDVKERYSGSCGLSGGYWCSSVCVDVGCWVYHIHIHIRLFLYLILYSSCLLIYLPFSLFPPNHSSKLFPCSVLLFIPITLSIILYVSMVSYSYLYSRLIPVPNCLTPHVLSEWMVEVCRFEVMWVSCSGCEIV